MKYMVRFLATGFGVGLSPKAPGTFGSLVGLGAAFLCHQQTLYLTAGSTEALNILLFGIIPGLLISGLAYVIIALEETWSSQHDAASTVIDEVAGQSLALLWFTPSWTTYILGFLLFRLFDIWKPSLIGWADKELSGALGTLLDDIIAGLVVAGLLGMLCLAFPNLLR